MKADWNLGDKVQFFVSGSRGSKATLVEGTNLPYDWKFPHYAGDGFYFVKIDGFEDIWVASEDDLIKIQEAK